MPTLRKYEAMYSNKGESDFSFMKPSLMSDVVYLNRKSGMSHEEIMNLPYGVFLKYIDYHQVMDLMETPEGRERLMWFNRLQTTDADISRLRSLGGYKAENKAGDE
jgi:hypothetical protein